MAAGVSMAVIVIASLGLYLGIHKAPCSIYGITALYTAYSMHRHQIRPGGWTYAYLLCMSHIYPSIVRRFREQRTK
ncbi:hypothetical protein F4823DRAFT_108881 [Ustulina deusta]|nr:hypothetical protein F4823DRAFT_108881 [Ustulina deusta]